MDGLTVIGEGRSGSIRCKRKDGLEIYLTGDKELDDIRENAEDPRVVILAVAKRVAQCVARSYARDYAPHLLADIDKIVGWDKPLLSGRKTMIISLDIT